MQRVQRGLIRIVKGPAGGFLASLGIAAVLGGVALASPAPPIAGVADHDPNVVVAAPLEHATASGSFASAVPTPRGGVRTDADPTGRGPALDPAENGHASRSSNGSYPAGSAPSGGIRSAGVAPPHQDARDHAAANGRPAHHHHGPARHHGSGSGDREHSAGSREREQRSGGHQGDNGSGSGDAGGSGSGGSSGQGGSGSSDRDRGSGSGSGRHGERGSGSAGTSTSGHASR